MVARSWWSATPTSIARPALEVERVGRVLGQLRLERLEGRREVRLVPVGRGQGLGPPVVARAVCRDEVGE